LRRKKNKRKAAQAKAPPPRHPDHYDDDVSIAWAEMAAEALQRPQPPKLPTIQEAIAQARSSGRPPKALAMIRERHAAGHSWKSIAADLKAAFGITKHPRTVRRWLREADK
jgi:hypothetical protein